MKVPRIVSRGYQCSHQNISIQVILMANVEKYKTMTCHPGVICMEMPAEAFIWKSKGEGVTYQDHLRRCIPFPYFGV